MQVGDPPVGGRYSLVEPFGADERFAGGKVQTWRARDTLVERDVVLRVITPGGNSSRLFLDRALEMSLVAHPGLGMVYEAVDHGEYAIVVCEWIDGTSLADTLAAHGPLTPTTARQTLGDVAEAIAEAHHAGLPIGGITAERVVLRDNAAVTLTAVPALFADERGDIQQLGLLLYAALTGHLPDPGDPDPARHLDRGVPRDLAVLCQRALDQDPARQLGSAAAFAAVLRPRNQSQSPPGATAGRTGDRLGGLDPDPEPTSHDTAPTPRSRSGRAGPDSPTTAPRAVPVLPDPNQGRSQLRPAAQPDPNQGRSQLRPTAQPDPNQGRTQLRPAAQPDPNQGRTQLRPAAQPVLAPPESAGQPAAGADQGLDPGEPITGPVTGPVTGDTDAKTPGRSTSRIPLGGAAPSADRVRASHTPSHAATDSATDSGGFPISYSADDYDPWTDDDSGTWGSYDDDSETGGPYEGSQTRRKVLLYAVPLIALALVVLLGVFVGKQFSDAVSRGDQDALAPTTESTEAATPTEAEPTEGQATEAPVALPAVSAAVYDPFGDGQPENNDEVGLSYDGDPASAWQTLTYQNSPEFGNLKPGVGIIFDLGEERTINAVELATNLPGTAIEIRVGAAPDAALDSYPVVDTLDPFTDSGSVELAEPVRARFVIVWFVRLVESNGGFQGALAECRILGS